MTAGREGLSETNRDDVPWGRPAVPGIPIPPFADAAQHGSYLRSLQTFVALLDRQEPAPATIALLAALAAEPQGPGPLSPLALRVSLATFFPAPWTPEALARALEGAFSGSPAAVRGGWAWYCDPDYRASRAGDGWRIERHERGERTRATLPAHDDLVLLWMDMFRDRFPYPIAHVRSTSAASPADLAAAAAATLSAHAVNAAMPYLTSWRTEREEALAAVRGEPGASTPTR